jgi:hypothetical protein
MSSEQRTRIAFIDDSDQVETLWVARAGQDLYRLENIPFFAYGVSMGDVVLARWRQEDLDELDEGEAPGAYGFPYFERVVQRGGNRTLRLAFEDSAVSDEPAREALARLTAMGCDYELFPPRLAAINVPPAVSLDGVMAYLVSTGRTWENGDPETADVPGRVAYLLEPGERPAAGEQEDRLGGVPPEVGAEAWPTCERCHAPMTFVLLLRAHPRRLRFVRRAAVALFTCCDDAVATLLPTRRAAIPAPRPPRVLPPRVPSYRRVEEHNPWADDREQPGGPAVDKVGGYPRWRVADHTPRCAECGEPMALVAQLTDALEPALGLGPGGVGYLFVCGAEHEARFVVEG